MQPTKADALTELISELIEALISDAKQCSCCSYPQVYGVREKLYDFLVEEM